MGEAKARLIILDLIRFFAAMAVVIFHYKSKYIETLPADSELGDAIYSITKFGYLGVDLFFLISGFVIFASAMNRTPSQFVISRATRVYPTFWVCSSITCLSILIYPDSSSITLLRSLGNSTFFHEYLKWMRAVILVPEIIFGLIMELIESNGARDPVAAI